MHNYLILLLLLSAFPVLFSCNTQNPNLSESKLQELMDEIIAEKEAFVLPDTTYVPPDGIRYREVRAIDTANPPAIIDIVGNLNNKKLFKLSDFASSTQYIFMQSPPDMEITTIKNIVSDDEHIFVNTIQGLFCYSAEGQYLYAVHINQLVPSLLSTGFRIVKGVLNNIDLYNGTLIFRTKRWPSLEERLTDVRLNVFDVKDLTAQMLFNTQSGEFNPEPQPKYQRQLSLTRDIGAFSNFFLLNAHSLFISTSFTNIALYGDTICRFNNYNRPVLRAGAGTMVVMPPSVYRIDGQLMLRKIHNDTVFRVIPPNRLVPSYILQWGEYRPDMDLWLAGSDLEGKLVIGSWVETLRFIFIRYTEGRSYPERRDEGKVKDHWAIYDKAAKTLTHHITSAQRYVLFENDIDPVGMPFYPTGLNHRNEMYRLFSKEQVKNYIATGNYQNDKLQAIHDNMPDGSFCLMIVK